MRRLSPVLLVALAACTQEPTANITVLTEGPYAAGQVVAFDASGSTDDHKVPLPLTYQWRLVDVPAGSAPIVYGADATTFSFQPDQYGDYTIGLVADNGDAPSVEATTTITIDPCGNEAPTVDGITASPAAPGAGEAVSLSAAVADVDVATCGLTQGLSYAWILTSVPAGSSASVSDPSAPAPWFLADVPGDYDVALVVTDSTGRASIAGTSTVTASACGVGSPAITGVTVLPTAPVTGGLVEIAVQASDPDVATCGLDDDLTVWTEVVDSPAGAVAQVLNAQSVHPGLIPDVPGLWVLRSFVSDVAGHTASVDIPLNVSTCGSAPPDAQAQVLAPYPAGPDDRVEIDMITDELVQLSAGASSDADFEAPCDGQGRLTWSWTFLERPAGSTADFNDPTVVNPSFVPDRSGHYEVLLEVRDEQGHVDTATIGLDATPIARISIVNGFTLEFVAGETSAWNNPRGIAVDSSGSIYVVQAGTGAVTRTFGSTTTWFAWGGYLNGIEDIYYSQDANAFFVSSTTWDQLIQINPVGQQTAWTRPGDLGNPRGITQYTAANGTKTLVVANDSANRVSFFNPTASANTPPLGSDDFGGRLSTPYGVEAGVVSSTNTWWVADANNDEIYRSNGSTDTTLTDWMNTPRDIVRSSTGKLYVADSGSGMLLRVDDCNGGGCAVTPILAGPWEPWGLWFENSGSLLITDAQGDALYRLTGSF